MSLFKPRRPRPFHHEWLYVNERRDRLKAIEQRARRELGMTSDDRSGPQPLWNHLRGAFTTDRLSEKHPKGRFFLRSNALAAFLLVISIAILFILLFS
jgi:hypothetical protein